MQTLRQHKFSAHAAADDLGLRLNAFRTMLSRLHINLTDYKQERKQLTDGVVWVVRRVNGRVACYGVRSCHFIQQDLDETLGLIGVFREADLAKRIARAISDRAAELPRQDTSWDEHQRQIRRVG